MEICLLIIRSAKVFKKYSFFVVVNKKRKELTFGQILKIFELIKIKTTITRKKGPVTMITRVVRAK